MLAWREPSRVSTSGRPSLLDDLNGRRHALLLVVIELSPPCAELVCVLHLPHAARIS